MNVDLSGLWVPLVTPFDTRDHVDLDALDALARRVVADGARGLVALGTTGEPATLTGEEAQAIVDVCVTVRRDTGAGLLVGVGTNCTRTTMAAVATLDPADIDAAMVVVPYYTRPSAAAVVDHMRAVAAHSAVPIVLYNVPYRTGRGLGAGELVELAGVPGVAGVKQAVGALDVDTLDVLSRAPSSFQVLAGDDAFIASTVLAGGAGAIAAAGHVLTPAFAELVEVAAAGDLGRVRALSGALLPVVQAGFAEPNPAVWKAALHRLGQIPTPALRAPMAAASSAATDAILDAIVAVTRASTAVVRGGDAATAPR